MASVYRCPPLIPGIATKASQDFAQAAQFDLMAAELGGLFCMDDGFNLLQI
jgi:hypothetical protein